MSNKKKRCPRKHLVRLMPDPIVWWCDKCQKDYPLTGPEKQVASFTITLGTQQGGNEVRRAVKNALGIEYE